jgi:hypothetical protein
VHRAEGARKAVTNSDVLGAAEPGRSIRLCIEAIVSLLYCAPVDAGEKCTVYALAAPTSLACGKLIMGPPTASLCTMDASSQSEGLLSEHHGIPSK